MADDMKNQRPHDANCGECDMAEFAGISYEAAHAQVESDVQRRGPQAMSEPIMQFFAFEHLPEPLQAVSRSFAELARALLTTLPRNPEAFKASSAPSSNSTTAGCTSAGAAAQRRLRGCNAAWAAPFLRAHPG